MRSAQSVDARSDIWSLGAVLHELLAGEPPFQADTVTALCARILSDPPRPLAELRAEIPSALARVVLRCLEKEPAQRYANVAEFARALSGFGSPAAEASAVRIGRVVEGKRGRASRASAPAAPVRSSGPLAGPALALVGDLPPTPMTPSRWSYALVALVLGVAGFAGVRVADHLRAVRLAERHVPAGLALQPVPPTTSPPVAPAPAASASTPTAIAVPSVPPPTPAPAPVAPIAAVPVEPPVAERHSSHRSVAAPRHTAHVDEGLLPVTETPRAAEPTVPPAPFASPPPMHTSPALTTPAPANPEALFDERK